MLLASPLLLWAQTPCRLVGSPVQEHRECFVSTHSKLTCLHVPTRQPEGPSGEAEGATGQCHWLG